MKTRAMGKSEGRGKGPQRNSPLRVKLAIYLLVDVEKEAAGVL
jgi:hypothetical protein